MFQKQPRVSAWVSQNYLTSYSVIRKLLRITTINSDDYVIEIGPGKGHITRVLIKVCRRVTAVEIDKKLYTRLLEHYGKEKNLTICCMDFMKWKLPVSGAYKVFANIPFCHTTAIMRKLTESKNPPAEAWLTMEKGAAKRFLGKPRENVRSMMIKPKFYIEIVYYLRRDDFHPKPGVDIVLVHIKRKMKPDVTSLQWDEYQRFVSNAFNEGLRSAFSKKQLSRAYGEAGISDMNRGEIRYIQWLCLFRSLNKYQR